MGVFEYLGVLPSVILGLGVTHILAGLSKIGPSLSSCC